MPDFYQTGSITTLPMLRERQEIRLDADLYEIRESRPMALILPCLSLELEHKGLDDVVRELGQVNYLTDIAVSIAAPDRDTYLKVANKFNGISTQSGEPPQFVWVDGPGVQSLVRELESEGFDLGQEGKSLSVWLAMGCLLLQSPIEVVATHDCDIKDYDRDLLARLLYPAAHPSLDYTFVKGYYPRFGDFLYGRVTRLLMFPLLQALKEVLPHNSLLEFMNSFRYPLAGECSMKFDFISRSNISRGWGVEISTLGEVFERVDVEEVCQVDLGPNYNHRHRELSPQNPNEGLHRMAIDVCKELFAMILGRSVEGALINHVREAYTRQAYGSIYRYRDLAAFNDLSFDVALEKETIDIFSRALFRAGQELSENRHSELKPANWKQIMVKLPNFLGKFGQTITEEAPR